MLLGALLDAGLSSMLVWVLKENPYRRFYESLGGHHCHTDFVELGEQRFAEFAYGWDDLAPLAANKEVPGP